VHASHEALTLVSPAAHPREESTKCKHQQLHQKSTNSYEIDIKRLGINSIMSSKDNTVKIEKLQIEALINDSIRDHTLKLGQLDRNWFSKSALL
jgi:hypothetical protein